MPFHSKALLALLIACLSNTAFSSDASKEATNYKVNCDLVLDRAGKVAKLHGSFEMGKDNNEWTSFASDGKGLILLGKLKRGVVESLSAEFLLVDASSRNPVIAGATQQLVIGKKSEMKAKTHPEKVTISTLVEPAQNSLLWKQPVSE